MSSLRRHQHAEYKIDSVIAPKRYKREPANARRKTPLSIRSIVHTDFTLIPRALAPPCGRYD